MSSDQEEQAKGRILTQYLDAKKRLVAIHSETAKMGVQLKSVGEALVNKSFSSPKIDENLPTLPTAEQVRELVREARATIKQRDEAQSALKELGVEVK